MPKKGYRDPNRNVVCDHCGQFVSALALDRALMLGQLLQTDGPLDIHDVSDRMGLSRETMRDVIKTYRRHLTGLVGKAVACVPDVAQSGRYVYALTDRWQSEDSPDIQQNESWFTKRIGEHVITARDMAMIALQNTDGRKRRQKADIADLVSVLTSVDERIRFMRERLLILEEELQQS